MKRQTVSIRRLVPLLAVLWGVWPGSALSSAQLALDQGCFSCHGEPPRRGVPDFAQLAASYAQYQQQADAPRRLVEKLRQGSLRAHIAAHERIDQQTCEVLMRWIINGAR